MPPERESRPAAHNGKPANSISTAIKNQVHSTATPDVSARFHDAYAVLVIGKAARRHVFFGLPAAQKAVERAQARGDFADLVLVRLVPVVGPWAGDAG